MKVSFMKVACSAMCVVSFFTGCQKDRLNENNLDEKFSITVSIPVEETKLVTAGEETAVQNYQVFLFKEDGSLEDYASTTTANITLDCTIGSKNVVALVNAPSFADVMDYGTLSEKMSYLSDNSADAFVMSGSLPLEVRSRDVVTIKLPVSRKVARVELSELKVEIDIPQYSKETFKVSSVYLINVAADLPYFYTADPNLWYNKGGYDPEDDNALIYDDMGDFVVTEQTPYTTKNTFYCYPNKVNADSFASEWCPRNTRLVVQAVLGDRTYYYPVTLPKLDANKTYQVYLTITRPGTDSPDVQFDKFDAPFEVTIKDWVRGATVTQEI